MCACVYVCVCGVCVYVCVCGVCVCVCVWCVCHGLGVEGLQTLNSGH